ncbi:hypothetical protein JOC74_002721 [Bacillus capparidis]|uniref:Uncharacterized protein n=1 Tax=Bacillus capparidis TaxID=1840411 RepID=A0ABS4CXZ4_9BACI|nr:hypothetical protein [Bacillus capparidis]
MDQKLDFLKKYTMKKDGNVRIILEDEIEKIDSFPLLGV